MQGGIKMVSDRQNIEWKKTIVIGQYICIVMGCTSSTIASLLMELEN